jgi:hypothetical protein
LHFRPKGIDLSLLDPWHPRHTILQEDFMKNRVLAFLVVFGALLCIAAPLAAQEEGGMYFRIALWDVKRTHWSSYEENFTKNQKPILDKLFAEGVITEWGITARSVHTEDGYTHSTWWSAKDRASLQRVLDAFNERNEQSSEAERKKRTAELTASIAGPWSFGLVPHKRMKVSSLDPRFKSNREKVASIENPGKNVIRQRTTGFSLKGRFLLMESMLSSFIPRPREASAYGVPYQAWRQTPK